MTMINPTKRQLQLIKLYNEKVLPWVCVDQNTCCHLLRDDAPEEVKKIYEMYKKSL